MTQPIFGSTFGPIGLQQEATGPYGPVRSINVPNASSAAISALMLLTDTNVRYVDPGGNDGTGDGSRVNPFRTVQPAIDNAKAAGAAVANAFAIRVSPGTGYGTFKLARGVFVVGSGSGSGDFNATPINGVTMLAPDATGLFDATMGGASAATTGILHACLTTALAADWTAVASTGDSRMLLQDVTTLSAVTFTGNNAQNYPTVDGLYINAVANLSFINTGGSTCRNMMSDFGGLFVFTQTAAYEAFHEVSGSSVDHFTVTTPAGSANRMVLSFADFTFNNNTITGTGGNVIGGISHRQVAADANGAMGFGYNAAATFIGVSLGLNVVEMTPTANRAVTIDRPIGSTTVSQIILRNRATAFVLDFTFPLGTIAAGGPTYVPPASEVRITFDATGGGLWMVQPIVQSGSTAMGVGTGVTAFIPADITARSSIVPQLKTWNGIAGEPDAKPGDRVVGTRVAGGGFKISSILLTDGTLVTSDQGTYDWHIAN